MRVPVISPGGKPLMPTKPSRARKWVREAKAIGKWNKLGQYYIQLTCEPSGESTQPIAVGIDPGKNYAGVGVQSSKITLFAAHLILPFETVKKRMEQRRMMRRSRRSRRINCQLPFKLRAHRQKGWVSGDTKTKVSVSDLNWKRIAQFSKSQVQLLHLSTGLICKPIVETGIPPAAKAGISCQKKI